MNVNVCVSKVIAVLADLESKNGEISIFRLKIMKKLPEEKLCEVSESFKMSHILEFDQEMHYHTNLEQHK